MGMDSHPDPPWSYPSPIDKDITAVVQDQAMPNRFFSLGLSSEKICNSSRPLRSGGTQSTWTQKAWDCPELAESGNARSRGGRMRGRTNREKTWMRGTKGGWTKGRWGEETETVRENKKQVDREADCLQQETLTLGHFSFLSSLWCSMSYTCPPTFLRNLISKSL
jgi:hypothetical protein